MRTYKTLLCILLLVFGFNSIYAVSNQSLQNVPSITFLKIDSSGSIYIEGELSTSAALGNEIGASFNFFESQKSSLYLSDPQKELRVEKTIHDKIGNSHVKFRQLFHDIPVVTGQIFTHFDKNNKINTVNGSLVRDISVDYIPSITSSEAVENAVSDLQSFFGNGSADDAELVIFPWEGEIYLSWRLFILSDSPMGRWEYFVDAHTGDIIYKANRIMSSAAIGAGFGVMGNSYDHIDTDFDGSEYFMIDKTRRLNNNVHGHDGQMSSGSVIQTYITSTSLPGNVAVDADNVWTASSQAAAVDGHVYSSLVYDWWLSEFGRNSFNDNGASMYTTVEYIAEGTNNAYWDGSRIVIWGASSGLNSLAGSPDVIAHEWGHAITQFTSNLYYEKESGALNESFSDMIGTAFEFAHPQYDSPDWNIGENISSSSSGFRSMSNPHLHGDPDTYGPTDIYWSDVINCTPSNNNDWCGVHTNSGVGNKWFYLLSDGGVHNGITVDGIGVANAIKVAYRANAFYWTSNSTYEEAASGTVSAANDLDSTFTWTIQVSKAWQAVGINAPNPEIRFTVDTSWGWVPFTVNFEGNSVLNVQSWDWDFGDGTNSNVQSPTHIFESGGTFDVTLAIDADGSIKTLLQPNYIIALADTISIDSFTVDAGTSIVVNVRIRNNTPLNSLIIPIEYSGMLTLTLDSISTIGCRTDYFDIQQYIQLDPFNKRFTYSIKNDPLQNTPDLPIGDGDILKMYFKVSESANPGDSVILSLDGYNTYTSKFSSNAISYDVAIESGKVLIPNCLMRGDVNGDSNINLSDLVAFIAYSFNNGTAPSPIGLADFDCNDVINLQDIVLLVAYMFEDGLPPCGC